MGIAQFGRAMKSPKCSRCGELDPAKFYGHKKSTCGTCHNKDVVIKGREKKQFLVDLLGGKCCRCGYNKYIGALDLHHTDPNEKDLNFKSMRGWSEERLIKEAAKCILLCSNCHREEHAEL